MSSALRVVSGTLFFPRGGSAYGARALAVGLAHEGLDVSLVAGSRRDLGEIADADVFYAGIDLHAVDFTDALGLPDPMAGDPPMHPSYEDRPGAPDPVFAALDDAACERQVAAWSVALLAAGAPDADVLYLHHLTPINGAAARVAPGVPVVAHLHGTEMLMLEAIAGAPDGRWLHGPAWSRRLRRWAGACAQLIVAPGNRERAAALLGLPLTRFVELPNGFDPVAFTPLQVDRRGVWRHALVEDPRGWAPGGPVGYGPEDLERLLAGPVVMYAGRFTAVKRLTLLIEAFTAARELMDTPASLVLVGGHPGEWEGEHPAETVARIGATNVFLAGWHDQTELPRLLGASDLLVLASDRESFGQVLVEAMACGVPPLAAASPGPSNIIDDGDTGWLFGVGDRAGLTAALLDAINRPAERARRSRLGEQAALARFTWPAVAKDLADVLADAARAEDSGLTREPSTRLN